ncbi:Uncharacterised protein [Actinobacillus pleuropneumoniae]|nr:Uncharacterised protein [Actinobacillus pleuropneumoniae]
MKKDIDLKPVVGYIVTTRKNPVKYMLNMKINMVFEFLKNIR